jgi:hypothetical protein
MTEGVSRRRFVSTTAGAAAAGLSGSAGTDRRSVGAEGKAAATLSSPRRRGYELPEVQ